VSDHFIGFVFICYLISCVDSLVLLETILEFFCPGGFRAALTMTIGVWQVLSARRIRLPPPARSALLRGEHCHSFFTTAVRSRDTQIRPGYLITVWIHGRCAGVAV